MLLWKVNSRPASERAKFRQFGTQRVAGNCEPGSVNPVARVRPRCTPIGIPLLILIPGTQLGHRNHPVECCGPPLMPPVWRFVRFGVKRPATPAL